MVQFFFPPTPRIIQPASLVALNDYFDGANTTNYSFAGVNLGTDLPTRRNLVVSSGVPGTAAYSTFTIAGVGVTQQLVTPGSFAIPIILGQATGATSGTSGTVVMNWNAGKNACSIQSFSLLDADPTPAFSNSVEDVTSGTTAIVPSVVCPQGGCLIAIATLAGTTPAFSGFSGVSGITTVFDLTPDSVYKVAIGIGNFPAGFGATSITATWASSTFNQRKLSVVTWGPSP